MKWRCVRKNYCTFRKSVIYFSVVTVCMFVMCSQNFHKFRLIPDIQIISSIKGVLENQKQPTQSDCESLLDKELLLAVNQLTFKTLVETTDFLTDTFFVPSDEQIVNYNNSFIIEPKGSCTGFEFILILIPSRPEEYHRRQAIRDTWGSPAHGGAWPWKGSNYQLRLLFVLGVTNVSSTMDSVVWFEHNRSTNVPQVVDNKRRDINAKLGEVVNPQTLIEIDAEHFLHRKMLSEKKDTAVDINLIYQQNIPNESTIFPTYELDILSESRLFEDILLIDILDTYTNLTLKLVSSFRWITKECENIKYILKVDQDIFVNIPLLVTFFKNYGKANTVYGTIIQGAKVMREGKWMVSGEIYPNSMYPNYASGNAYVISRDAIEKMLRLAPQHRYLPMEDVFITGVLALLADVERVNVEGFTYWESAFPHPCSIVNNRQFAGNRFTEEDHRNTWRLIQNNGSGMCDFCRWSPWVVEVGVIYTNC